MSVIYESQVYAACDVCGANEASSVYTLAKFKQILRHEGWTIGKNTICPICNEMRIRKVSDEDSCESD